MTSLRQFSTMSKSSIHAFNNSFNFKGKEVIYPLKIFASFLLKWKPFHSCKVNAWLSGSSLPDKHSIQVHNKFFKNGQINMLFNFQDFHIVIFDYQMFTHS
jgi:hypothetical protein